MFARDSARMIRIYFFARDAAGSHARSQPGCMPVACRPVLQDSGFGNYRSRDPGLRLHGLGLRAQGLGLRDKA